MRILLTRSTGHLSDDSAVGLVHLEGAFDSTACGLAYEEYDYKTTKKPISCTTCNTVLSWAREASKKNKTAHKGTNDQK